MDHFWVIGLFINALTTKKNQTLVLDVPEQFKEKPKFYGIHETEENFNNFEEKKTNQEQENESPTNEFISNLLETKKYKEGKPVIIITGASGGIGYEITKAAALEGKYTVIMACRNLKKAEAVKEKIINETKFEDIEVMQLDLSSIKSVIAFADELLQRGVKVVRLMNNAGTMPGERKITEDGFEETCETNYIAPLLLTLKLLPLMPKGARIVNMLSVTYSWSRLDEEFFTKGMKGTYHRMPVYCNTKQAFLFATLKLAEILLPHGIYIAGSDPGVASTGIIHMNMWFDPLADLIARPIMSTPAQGASPAVKLLFDEMPSYGCLYAQSGKKDVREYKYDIQKESVFKQTIDILKNYF